MDSETVQNYARRFLYWASGALVTHGIVAPGAFWLEPAIGLILTLVTFAWSMYGSRLNGLLSRVQATDGVEKTNVVVDPNKISPTSVNVNTPNGVSATPS
jgi:hypothetical protein